MRRLRTLGRGGRLLLALAVGGALFGIATAVQADIPDSGTINACYYTPGKLPPANPRKGALRVIDTSKGQTCTKDETALSWNAAGVTGAKGMTGATGPTGAAGVSGITISYLAHVQAGPGEVETANGCADRNKIAIGGSVWDQTNPANVTMQSTGNGSLFFPSDTYDWYYYYDLGPTTGAGDTILYEIVCANP